MKTVINEIETGKILFQCEGDFSLDHQNGIVEIEGINYRFFYNKLVIKNGNVIKIVNVSRLAEPYREPYPLPSI